MKVIGGTVLALIAISLVIAQDESKTESKGGRRFEGTWDVQVTVRDCQTLAIIRTFPAIATFMSGGAMFVSEAGTEPRLKTLGQGVWSHVERNSYRFRSKAFNFNASGVFTGWMTITNEANLNHSADGFESTGIANVYSPNGISVFTGCSTLTATRFE